MGSAIDISKVVWKSEYNIGNLKIDQEHQKLFLLARKALALNAKNSKEVFVELKEIIKELYKYVRVHFENEQEYMYKVQYPDLDNHKNIHKNILDMLNNLIKELNSLKLEVIERRLYDFIEEYFINHIIMEDKKIHLWSTPLDELRKSFGWKDIYSVGDDRIDSEHKKLFDIAQEAFNVVDDKKRAYKIKEVVISLYSYMQTHFEHEEDYMEDIGYPNFEKHKKLHENITQSMNDFLKKLPTLDVELFEKELARLIDIALVQHIIQEDRKIMDFTNIN